MRPGSRRSKKAAARLERFERLEETMALVTASDTPTVQRGTPLSSLPFAISIKQGEKKREKRRKSASNAGSEDSESRIGLGVGNRNDDSATSVTNTETADSTTASSKTYFDNHHQHQLNNGGSNNKEIIRGEGEAAARYDENETPTQASYLFPATSAATIPHQRPQQLQSYRPTTYDPLRTADSAPYFEHNSERRPIYPPSRSYSTSSSIQSEEVTKGLNDYSSFLNTPESQAEVESMMNNLAAAVFDVEEWDPDLPSGADPDASPERLTMQPQPLTYTTVGSVVKPTDNRHFTAPNRIQREGRAGLEVAGRRPMLTSATSARGQELYPTRNTSQYSAPPSYSQVVTHNLMREQPPIGQYQASQQARPNFMSGQSSMGNHSMSQAGGQGFAQDQSTMANHTSSQFGTPHFAPDQSSMANRSSSQFGAPTSAQDQADRQGGQGFAQDQSAMAQHSSSQFGAPNFGQDQVNRQASYQQQSSMCQSSGNTSASNYHSEPPHHDSTEQAMSIHGLTPQEEEVFRNLGLPPPMAPMTTHETKSLAANTANAGRSLPQKLTPIQEEMLAQLHAAKPQEQFKAMSRASAPQSATDVLTAQRQTPGMNRDTPVPNPSITSTPRFGDFKMSTVQRLAQFPNPDQERAKARLAELAASKMRGNDENQRPGQSELYKRTPQSAKDLNTQFDPDFISLSGIDGEPDAHYQGNRSELDYGFRFPNTGANPRQQTYASTGGSSYSSKTVVGPRKTPQGYPQPLTAGPPGQRQNNAPSSNKALNSMQQMLGNGNQRHSNPYSHYGQPSQPLQTTATPLSYVPQHPGLQQSSAGARIVPNPETYPWGRLDQQPRDFTDGAPPRVRETLSYDEAKKFYPKGMDMDTIRSFITTLSPEDAAKFYAAGGMDESTKKWYEEERKWQQQPQSDLGKLLSGSVEFKDWIHSTDFRRENNFNKVPGSDPRLGDPTDSWFHNRRADTNPTKEGKSVNKNDENGGPGITGTQAGDEKRLTLDEIKSKPLPAISGYLFDNMFATLSKFADRTPEGLARLAAMGYGPAPTHAINHRPGGNLSMFDSEWAQPPRYHPSSNQPGGNQPGGNQSGGNQPGDTQPGGKKNEGLGGQQASFGGGRGHNQPGDKKKDDLGDQQASSSGGRGH